MSGGGSGGPRLRNKNIKIMWGLRLPLPTKFVFVLFGCTWGWTTARQGELRLETFRKRFGALDWLQPGRGEGPANLLSN